MDYKELIERLNSFSAEHEQHGGITAEAADAIETLLKERDAVIAELSKPHTCENCKHRIQFPNGACSRCKQHDRACIGDNWEWRGLPS